MQKKKKKKNFTTRRVLRMSSNASVEIYKIYRGDISKADMFVVVCASLLPEKMPGKLSNEGRGGVLSLAC